VITYTVCVTTRPSEHERFVAAARALRDASVKENGNLEYSLWAPLDGDNQVLVIERWRDQDAVESHHQSPHMSTFRAAVKGAVAAPPRSSRAEEDEEA
jgi:quinol monooxygenase YgiN